MQNHGIPSGIHDIRLPKNVRHLSGQFLHRISDCLIYDIRNMRFGFSNFFIDYFPDFVFANQLERIVHIFFSGRHKIAQDTNNSTRYNQYDFYNAHLNLPFSYILHGYIKISYSF